jgi:hypothetical protein
MDKVIERFQEIAEQVRNAGKKARGEVKAPKAEAPAGGAIPEKQQETLDRYRNRMAQGDGKYDFFIHHGKILAKYTTPTGFTVFDRILPDGSVNHGGNWPVGGDKAITPERRKELDRDKKAKFGQGDPSPLAVSIPDLDLNGASTEQKKLPGKITHDVLGGDIHIDSPGFGPSAIPQVRVSGIYSAPVAAESATPMAPDPLMAPEPDTGKAQRFEIGKKLSPEQKKAVLDTVQDRYKETGHQKVMVGLNQFDEEIWRYPYDRERFVVSDITGAKLRHYIRLPDGKIAHPSEVFPNITQNDVINAVGEIQEKRRLAKRQEQEKLDRAKMSYATGHYRG